MLSASLIESLEAASAMEAKCVAAAPKGDKPHIIEGDLFVGNHEGATEVAYGKLRREGDTAFAESDLVYVDGRFPKAHRHRAVAWKDRVEMRRVGDHWQVTDIRFAGNRTLAQTLKAYMAEGARTCGKPDQNKRTGK